MNGAEIIAEGKGSTIMLSWDQVEALVEYALRELMKKGKGN
jgi:hypothetical protein